MSSLPDPPSQISMTEINTQLGSSGESRLSEREGRAMTGSTGAGPYSIYSQGLAGICMPNAGTITVTRPNPTSANAVFYSGPSTAWRPSQMSEFRSGYGTPGSAANKPQFTGASIGETGNQNTGTVTLTFSKGLKTSVVYVTIEGIATTALNWTGTTGTSIGPITINRNQGGSTSPPAEVYTAYIQDQWGCGGNREFFLSGIQYTI